MKRPNTLKRLSWIGILVALLSVSLVAEASAQERKARKSRSSNRVEKAERSKPATQARKRTTRKKDEQKRPPNRTQRTTTRPTRERSTTRTTRRTNRPSNRAQRPTDDKRKRRQAERPRRDRNTGQRDVVKRTRETTRNTRTRNNRSETNRRNERRRDETRRNNDRKREETRRKNNRKREETRRKNNRKREETRQRNNRRQETRRRSGRSARQGSGRIVRNNGRYERRHRRNFRWKRPKFRTKLWYGSRYRGSNWRSRTNRYYKRQYYRAGRRAHGFYIHVPSYRHYNVNRTSRFVFKQTVRNQGNFRYGNSDIEVHAYLKQKVYKTLLNQVRMAYTVEQIALYQNGQFLGEVTRIPNRLETIRATLHNDGYVEFDRMLYVVGDPEVGFELLSTKYYGGHLMSEFKRGHDVRTGVMDLYSGTVRSVRHSQLFDPYQYQGLTPVAIVPDDDYWGYQYMAGGSHYSDDYYYGGSYNYYDEDLYSYQYGNGYGNDYYDDFDESSYRQGVLPSFKTNGSGPAVQRSHSGRSFANTGTVQFRTQGGQDVSLSRRVEIQSLDVNR